MCLALGRLASGVSHVFARWCCVFLWEPKLFCHYVHCAWSFGFQVFHMCVPVGVGLFWKTFFFILKSA